MCQIIYSPRGVVPANLADAIEAESRCNRDGLGYILYSGGGRPCEVYHTLAPNIGEVVAKLAAHKAAWAVHLRFRTHGAVSLPNCHPFDIGHGRWIMHNGQLSLSAVGERSDTAILADILRAIPRSRQDAILADLVEAAGNGSRLLVLGQKSDDNRIFGHWSDYPGQESVITSTALAVSRKSHCVVWPDWRDDYHVYRADEDEEDTTVTIDDDEVDYDAVSAIVAEALGDFTPEEFVRLRPAEAARLLGSLMM